MKSTKHTLKAWADRKAQAAAAKAQTAVATAGRKLSSECGQGTAEYAILIAVVVVAAVVLVVAFGDKLTAIWTNANSQMSTVQSYTSPHA